MSDSAEPGALRASDQERNEVSSALGEHFSTGRLDLVEYERRVDEALAARTVGELADLFADLPVPRPEFVTRLVAPPPTPLPASPQLPLYPATYAPYGVDPFTGHPYSDKSRVLAGLLQIFFGAFGVGRFYAGRSGIGMAQVLMTVFSLGILSLITVPWGMIDGIIMLTGNSTDGNGRKLH